MKKAGEWFDWIFAPVMLGGAVWWAYLAFTADSQALGVACSAITMACITLAWVSRVADRLSRNEAALLALLGFLRGIYPTTEDAEADR